MLASRSDDVRVTFRIGSTADEEEENSLVAHGSIQETDSLVSLLWQTASLLLYSSGVVVVSLFAKRFGHISCDVYLLSSHHEFQDKCSRALKEVSGDSCNCSQ